MGIYVHIPSIYDNVTATLSGKSVGFLFVKVFLWTITQLNKLKILPKNG